MKKGGRKKKERKKKGEKKTIFPRAIFIFYSREK